MIEVVLNPDGTPGITVSDLKVQPLQKWQLDNLHLDAGLRVGLPIVAFLLYRAGHKYAALAAAAGGGVLWANRLGAVRL